MTITERADRFIEAEHQLDQAVRIIVDVMGVDRGEEVALVIVAESVKRHEYRRQLAQALAKESAP